MENPARPFERYRTRSALFLMIYAVTALIFGIPNIRIVSTGDDKFLMLFLTSFLVVSRYMGYIKLAGLALLDPAKFKAREGRFMPEVVIIALVLIANAVFLLWRFALSDMTVIAVSAGCLMAAGVLIGYLFAFGGKGINRSKIMRMVSGVLVAIGAADIVITKNFILPQIVGLITLFFGIYTERKSIFLALKQTFAAATSAAGAGMAVYFVRFYFEPKIFVTSKIFPPYTALLGLVMAVVGLAYYFYSRRLYTAETGA